MVVVVCVRACVHTGLCDGPCCSIAVQVKGVCVACGQSTVALLGLGYFVPMALTMSAILARLARCCEVMEVNLAAYGTVVSTRGDE